MTELISKEEVLETIKQCQKHAKIKGYPFDNIVLASLIQKMPGIDSDEFLRKYEKQTLEKWEIMESIPPLDDFRAYGLDK